MKKYQCDENYSSDENDPWGKDSPLSEKLIPGMKMYHCDGN